MFSESVQSLIQKKKKTLGVFEKMKGDLHSIIDRMKLAKARSEEKVKKLQQQVREQVAEMDVADQEIASSWKTIENIEKIVGQ